MPKQPKNTEQNTQISISLNAKTRSNFLINGSVLAALLVPVVAFSSIGVPAVPNDDVPNKSITIYNDTNKTIYPVIESGTDSSGFDNLLSARFGSQITRKDHYRLYLGGITGIPANQKLTFNLPLYTVTGSTGPMTDHYIDWWNGARVYLYGDSGAIKNLYNNDVSQDQAQSVKPIQVSGVAVGGVSVDSYAFDDFHNQGPSISDPFQLLEWNLGAVAADKTFNSVPVDFDVSYVDAAYLPVAMEDDSAASYGYSGSADNGDDFNTALINFISTGWPTYNKVNYASDSYLKIPSTANLQSTDVSSNSQLSKIAAKWNSIQCDGTDAQCTQFKDNIADIVNSYGLNLSSPDLVTFEKIFSYPDKVNSKEWNTEIGDEIRAALYGVPYLPYSSHQSDGVNNWKTFSLPASRAQTYLGLDPYADMLEGDGKAISSYKFSIDDVSGNSNVTYVPVIKTGSIGIIIDVGGTSHFSNATPNANIYVNVPKEMDHATFSWTDMKGSHTENDPIASASLATDFSFRLHNSPTTVTVYDSKGELYHFDANYDVNSPVKSPSVSNCQNATGVIEPYCDAVETTAYNTISTPGLKLLHVNFQNGWALKSTVGSQTLPIGTEGSGSIILNQLPAEVKLYDSEDQATPDLDFSITSDILTSADPTAALQNACKVSSVRQDLCTTNLSYDAKTSTIQLPAYTSPPPASAFANLYPAPGWDTITVDGHSVSTSVMDPIKASGAVVEMFSNNNSEDVKFTVPARPVNSATVQATCSGSDLVCKNIQATDGAPANINIPPPM
ncbi:MAG: hypothetical protein A3F17_08735 [Gammaproteobacteria bacterium RIFCSPHIGHO2_12_FULL_41_15]|nr:MAG: hypothetical protein A3F17_08735 [Gammaproteobacteria bacterium RIFCSPHIGHO2_12_FULL_41_15]